MTSESVEWSVDPRITDPDARDYLARLGPPRPRAGASISEIRARPRRPLAVDPGAYALEVEDVRLPVPASLTGRMYRPADRPAVATMLYLHGGGWALGDLDINDDVCRFLAHHAGIVVLSLEYSLAPEHPFPTSLDEATTVATLIAAGALDAPSTLLLGGLSAGGSLAAAVAARGVTGTAPRAQSLTLLSPVTDSDVDRPSMLDYATAPVLTRTDMQWFWSMYDPHGIHRADPDAAPIRAESFHGLPPTTVVVAGVDPLRDEGIAYADALREADVDVALEVVEGVPHGFMAVPSIRSGRRSLTRCAERISEAIAGSIG